MASIIKERWRDFEQARVFVKQLKFKNADDWFHYCKGKILNLDPLPKDIPRTPWTVYKKSWKGFKHWLGTSWRTYEDAREFVIKLEIKNYEEWLDYVAGKIPGKAKLPDDIPNSPQTVYRKMGWKGWGDWLRGKSKHVKISRGQRIRPQKRKIDYLPFIEARSFARRLGLKSSSEWNRFCRGETTSIVKLPHNLPTAPHRTYRNDGWVNYPDWLGYENDFQKLRRSTRSRSFEQARMFVRSLHLKSFTEWLHYSQAKLEGLPPLPLDIPKTPNITYKNKGWNGFSDWIGIEGPFSKWLSYEKAQEFAHSLKLKSYVEWWKYCTGKLSHLIEKPSNIPSNPSSVYNGRGWKNWPIWLGNNPKRGKGRKWRGYVQAREFVRVLRIKSAKDWYAYCKNGKDGFPNLPYDIPSCPDRNYKNSGWTNWLDWLGKTKVREKLKG